MIGDNFGGRTSAGNRFFLPQISSFQQLAGDVMTKGGKFLGPITGKTQHAWNKITTVTSRGFIRGEARRRRNTMFNRSHPPTGGEEPAACLQTSDTVFQQKHPAAHEPARISPIKSSICTIDRRPAAAAAPGEKTSRGARSR